MKALFSQHRRLLIATLAGVLVYCLLPSEWAVLSRVLVAWNGGVLLFLVLMYRWMTSLSAEQICRRFIEEDESAGVVLILVTAAALLSLAAIIAVLATIKQTSGSERTAHVVLAAITVVDSWLLVPTIFTSQYADLFYSASAEQRPLHFPNTTMPIFWDFVYFSFTIAAACQTADVATTQVSMRKLVVAHTLISFVFNASILGFAINVTAGLLGGG
jgi:uncharacterized membrane protein